MFVVAGSTGNTGSVVAQTLLDQKREVRVIVRDEAKGAAWKAKGAQVAVANLDDASALTTALKGAEAAYLLVPPPGYTATGILASRRAVADAEAQAVEASGVKYVVALSSVGADKTEGTGIVKSLHYFEERFAKLKTNVTFLRAGSFVENWGAVLQAAQHAGVLPTNGIVDRKIMTVSARDIGLTVAKLLVEPKPGHRVVNLAGPVDVSPNDVAAVLEKILGKKLQVVFGPADASMVKTLTSFGIGAELAELYRELSDGLNRGHVDWQPGVELLRGSTPIEQTLRAMLPH